ncbi:type VI secretion system baseplate subunit TssE [Acerihabitans arboris]|uniref:Type VI secretion system baseplate subunit TssE n=1 Tax=Acerihabitans arboris TaxID=2691583 RepID=A0A845SN68_9GAMM|nr:type VI secretion system baseplate subunit TssE [Acerihabitans arboris]NDL64396.1 type VI secretion system baseplate subunit TssE [Acerihabitans arboris]
MQIKHARVPAGGDPDRAHQRVAPLLLERLTDNDPDNPDDAPLDMPALRERLKKSVLANLQALLNCTCFASRDQLARWPHVYSSTLNFGLPPLAGKMQSDIAWQDIADQITWAIAHFEPRIIASALCIECLDDDPGLASHNLLSFTLQGRLWWSPAPVDFMFTSRVDLENGHFELADKR